VATVENSSPNLSPVERVMEIHKRLLAVSGKYLSRSLARNQAFQWLIEEDCVNISPADPFLIQRYVLAVLYFSTNGKKWHSSDFLSCKHECGWFSNQVQCNKKMEVSKILLNENNLLGEIPFELQELKSLNELNLGNNFLTGSIPQSLGNLPLLDTLNLSENRLEGPIPASIFNIKALSYLRLNDNRLFGTIPPEINKLDSLTFVQLHKNELFGEVPSLLNLRNLEVLHLHQNNLSGNINFSVCPLTKFSLVLLWAPCVVDCICCNNAKICSAVKKRPRYGRKRASINRPTTILNTVQF